MLKPSRLNDFNSSILRIEVRNRKSPLPLLVPRVPTLNINLLEKVLELIERFKPSQVRERYTDEQVDDIFLVLFPPTPPDSVRCNGDFSRVLNH